MIVSIRALRKLVVLAALAGALVVAGCGGDDDDAGSGAPEASTPSTTETTPPSDTSTEVDPETETLPNDGNGNGVGGGTTAPGEDQEGGAGDEVPARSLALFTGKDGDVTPRTVQVPAYISIRVELRSDDGAEYSLAFGDKKLTVTDPLHSVATTFDGLRPGAKLVGTVGGSGAKVVVSATAEPGP